MPLNHKNQSTNFKKAKMASESSQEECPDLLGTVCYDALLKGLHRPLEQAGILLVPTVIKLNPERHRRMLAMTISFVAINNASDKVIAHYTGPSIGLENTITLILEL